MPTQVRLQLSHIKMDAINIRLTSQHATRRLGSHPSRQGHIGDAQLTLNIRQLILQRQHLCTRRQHIGLRVAATAISALAGNELLPCLLHLLADQRQHLLQVITLQPGFAGGTQNLGLCQSFPGIGEQRLTLLTLAPKLAFVRTRELLHEANTAHGHEVAAQTEAICRIHRQVIDAQTQRRVRPLTGRDRQLASGSNGRILRNQP